jgi:hypothetical protein
MGRNLAWIGVVIFAISWFVPVVKGQDMASGLAELGSAASEGKSSFGGPPGWQACRMAWTFLTDGDSPKGGDAWRTRVCGATCLTNVAMLLGIFILLSRRTGAAGMGVVLLACAALNLSWLVLGDGDFRSILTVGYYLWVGSFVLVGLGLRSEA